jgi:hypothetical protein
LRLQDLVEGEQHKDAGVFVQLCVHKVFGKGLFARFVSLIFSQIIYNVFEITDGKKGKMCYQLNAIFLLGVANHLLI